MSDVKISGVQVGTHTRIIDVQATSASYTVFIGAHILEHAGKLVRESVRSADATKAYLVSDTNVEPLYAATVEKSLVAAGFTVYTHNFAAGEASKRINTLSDLLEGLAQAGLSHKDVVVALGGGVVGDIAGLAAGLYLRGIDVIQMPTSLLAMVDSSVGGKTAIDLEAGKNLAGVFLQPRAVIADVSCLDTLSAELFRDSCGEVIKHAVLADPTLFSQLSAKALTQHNYTHDELIDIIARNITIKRDVVQADETEEGLRQVLNLGHTIGHAIEAASHFELGHGSCVAAGLCCMVRGAVGLGWCTPQLLDTIETVVAAHGLPTDTALDHDVLFTYACRDKKRLSDKAHLVVPTKIGHVTIKTVGTDILKQVIDKGCLSASAPSSTNA